jgi:hypothetical protein
MQFLWEETENGVHDVPQHPKIHARVRYEII